MTQFVVLKNRNLIGVYASAPEARAVMLEEINKSPRATIEAAKLVRRVTAERGPPTFTVIEEDLDP